MTAGSRNEWWERETLKERKLMQECMIELADPIGTWVFNSHEAAEKSQEMHIKTILLGQEREIYPAASICLWSRAVVGQSLNSPVLWVVHKYVNWFFSRRNKKF